MRKLAPRVLKAAGYRIVEETSPSGQQFIRVQDPGGEEAVIWMKCAWRPGTHGHGAVQIDFPKEYEPTIAWAVGAVEAKVKRTRARGATHLLLLAADNAGKKATAAFLAPIDAIPRVFHETAKINPKLARNGKSPSLYAIGPSAAHKEMIAPLAAVATDLLTGPVSFEDQHGPVTSEPAGTSSPRGTR